MSYKTRMAAVALVLCTAVPALAQKQPPRADKPPRAAKAKVDKATGKVDVAKERAALFGADAQAAAAAATRLGQASQAGALDALLDGLALGLDPTVAAAALEGLARHADPRAFDVLDHYRHYRTPRVRAAAVEGLGALDDARAAGGVLHALHDGDALVRAAAARVVAARKLQKGVELLLALLQKGDEGSVEPLAQMASAELAKEVAELIGVAPDGLLARCLGMILLRPDFKEEARLEVVRAIGKISGDEALEQLTTYVASVPENPPRQSRREAEAIVEARLGGN
jgi:HEAT repeat protein